MLAKAGGLVAPDANSTLRVTFGQVKGVDAKDGLYYKPQTTLAGICTKAYRRGALRRAQNPTGRHQGLRSGKKTPYLDASLGDVPVNFLSTVMFDTAIPAPRKRLALVTDQGGAA